MWEIPWRTVAVGVLAALLSAVLYTAFGWIFAPVALALTVVGGTLQIWEWVSPAPRDSKGAGIRLAGVVGIVVGVVIVFVVRGGGGPSSPEIDGAQADGDERSPVTRDSTDDTERRRPPSTARTTTTATSTSAPTSVDQGGGAGPLGDLYGEPQPPLPGDGWHDERARNHYITVDCLPAWQGRFVAAVWGEAEAETFCACLYDDIVASSGLSFEEVNEVRTSATPDQETFQRINAAEDEAILRCTPDS